MLRNNLSTYLHTMKSKIKFQLSSKRQVAFTIILIAVMVAIGGYWYYSREKEQIIRQKEETLTAIATLKAKQIEIWYRDNLNDAQVISANPNLVEVAIRFIQSNWPIDRARLLVLLKQIQLEHELAEVFLTSSDGSIIAATNSQIAPIHPDELSSLKNAIHKGEAVSTGFFNAIQNGNKQSLISFISPLNTGVNNLSYAIIMRVDATNDILPLIESWPTESQTGESFIFSNETNSILLFNELKHQFEIETRDKLMVKKDDLLSNIYTSKQPGIYQGKDYRNVDVLASIKAIEGTNWVLIAKVDKSELLQDVMRLTLLTLVWVLLIVALSGLFIVAWYNKRQKNIYKGLLVNERELWAQQEKFNVIMDSLGDGIITLDLNGNIQYLNTRAEELTGWNLREARGRDFHEVYNVINEETRQQENNILDKVLKKGLVKELGNHTLLISKSGTEIPVMDTGAPLFDESGTVTGIAISFQDETEKRSQSRLLKQSEEKYRILVKNIPQKVFMKNQELSYIFCNENFADDLGITPDEIAGKTDYDFFSKEMADKYRNDDRFILENGETITLEEEYKAKDISFWVKTTKTPIKDEKGRTIGLLGIFEDITEKMRAQIALMKSEESLREFFEADLTGDYSATADSKILHCNPAFVGILGYGTAEEILGRNIAEMYQNPAERQEFLNLIQNQKVIKNYQSKLKRKDGTNIICNENIVGKFDANGKLVQYLGYMYDVTDKISAEEELRKKEQLLSSVMETQQELICRFLPDTTLTFVNKAYCKIFGRNEQELIGSKFLELIPENEWDGIMSVLKNINAENPSHTYVSSAYKPDGSVMSMEWTDTAILKKQNDVVEFQSVGRDITEKLKAEQELIEAKDKAEESDKLKSAFINNISHEIRTPLNGILGFGQLLAGSDIPPDKRMKYYDIVQESSNRLMNTLTDYLDMALIVSGTMEAQKKEFRLQPLFEEIIEKTKPVCADKMIELRSEERRVG